MQYFGFGYNGFGQLIQQSSLHVTAIDTAVKIMNESTLGDDAVENDVSMVTSNWSSISICKGQEVHLQGFIHGKRNQKKSYSSAVPVLDILLTEEDLFILMNDGKSCKVIKYTSTLVEDKIMQIRRLKNSEGDVFEETGLQQITYGDTHMVAVTGRNEAGELEIKDDSYMIFKPFITNIIVKQVSCGKEHVLLLSHSGEVFSYGLGSRGQLGHGTAEPELTPRVIEALQGVAMATVAAGGWHSAAVSCIGDLYMWGWNESGQLGLPMKDPPGNDTERKFGMLGLPNKDPPNKEKETCPDSDTKKHSTDNEIKKDEYEKTQCSENAPNVKEEEMTVTVETAGKKRKEHSIFCKDEYNQEKDLKKEKCTSKKEDFTDTMADLDTVILCQTLPCLMEFPIEVNVSKVSCGSRHTAALTDTGELYTWGWNQYGQLGQNNNRTTDVITLVPYFKQHVLNIKDIYCGPWNTIVTVKTN